MAGTAKPLDEPNGTDNWVSEATFGTGIHRRRPVRRRWCVGFLRRADASMPISRMSSYEPMG